MMKKLLLVVAMAVMALTTQAQFVKEQRSPLMFGQRQHHAMQAPAKADNSGIWWGYYDGVGERSALGVQSAETYYQAIRIDPTNAALVGKTITKVRVYLRDTSVLENISLWLSTDLPATADEATVMNKQFRPTDLNGGDEGDYYNGKSTDVTLPEPYTITDEGVYVGMTYTVTSVSSSAGQYPIVVTYDAEEQPSALFLKTSSSVPTWQDMSQYGYGNLAMQLLVEGDFASNAASIVGVNELVAAPGQTVHRNVTINNQGAKGISSIDYTITANGVEGEMQHVNLPVPCDVFGGNVVVKMPFQGLDTPGTDEVTITIKQVNGEANETVEGASYTAPILTVDRQVERRAVIEEFTGLGCGWCPRGIVGMEMVREHFGDLFIGIAAHLYSGATTDAMALGSASNYARIFSGSAPSCLLNRMGGEIDPKYGTGNSIINDIQDELDNVAAKADVTVEGEWNEEKTGLTAKAEVEALADENFTVAFVVVADNLSGTTTKWRQANYYSQYTTAQVGDSDMEDFCKGGKYGQSSVSGLLFNDVALATSYVNYNNKVEALGAMTRGEKAEREYTLTLPNRVDLKTALAEAQERGDIFIVALVIDSKGYITNAVKATIQEAATGIEGVTSSSDVTERARYNVDGMRLQAPTRGLNIIRMSDGSVRKVMVK
ncbi:MAG: hemin-binding protein [Prevotella sp.]|nr:hemin-binding protein [Prevotella sp.]